MHLNFHNVIIYKMLAEVLRFTDNQTKTSPPEIHVFYGTFSGTAELVAEKLAKALKVDLSPASDLEKMNALNGWYVNVLKICLLGRPPPSFIEDIHLERGSDITSEMVFDLKIKSGTIN